MTAKTPTALGTESASVYTDNRAPAAITPARIGPINQGIIDSYAYWDDPSNVGGLGADLPRHGITDARLWRDSREPSNLADAASECDERTGGM
jgi:hypothetical protein